jgi:hypothetical protein
MLQASGRIGLKFKNQSFVLGFDKAKTGVTI